VRGQRSVGMCVASSLNSILQFITETGTTIGGIREIEEGSLYENYMKIKNHFCFEKATKYPCFKLVKKIYLQK
jgi:hypothetical protein